MKVEPQNEHAWLHRLIGDWTYEVKACMKPGEPPQKFTGTESVRSVGGIWIVAEGQGEMPGGGMATTILTLGFDPKSGRFVGSWVGSMMTHLWVYEGTLDAAAKVLTLACEGPAFDGEETTTKYKDVHTLISDNERTLSGNCLGKDGKWSEMMTCTYRRAR
ncbi:MAG TPA: DUF1579 domain-containing protein [Candidatus Deferrimicrobium sp.]|nr:DUF1579 domain-containing protein [Candidatus Deferrimicrobium sp.]